MFIREIVIDGFKSYAQRTVISGFDKQFNAITGRNGSGKSNILDSICFLLGISNLSQVRAGNLQELVYKQGQTGVTKASVSITFDNSDPSQSPVGYESYKELTVTRQVVIGGRNKYLINGHNANQATVQNLFHSVQLNVNNPHFLIMQGRITKVLNMKPPEILGMVEEAAGTRMFETKKQGALKTIAKKQTKVDEINEVLANEIMPLLEKLRTQRQDYDKWSSQNAECERLDRLVTAYRFCQALDKLGDAGSEGTKMEEDLEALRATKQQCEAEAEEMGAAIAELSARKAETLESGFKAAQTAEEELSKKLVQVNSAWQNKGSSLEDERKALETAKAQGAEAEAQTAALEATLDKLEGAAQEAAAEATASTGRVTTMQDELQGVMSGLRTGGGDQDGNLADQLKAAEQSVQKSLTSIKAMEMKLSAVGSSRKELQSNMARMRKQASALVRKHEAAVKKLASIEARIERLGFDPSREEPLRQARADTAKAVEELTDAVGAAEAKLSARLRFEFDESAVARALGGKQSKGKGRRGGAGGGAGASAGAQGWSSDRVKGVVANLVRVKQPKAATALEVAAGGKLFQVVVDSEETGKALLKHGRLKRRVTIIPLNKVRHSTLKPAVVATAAKVSKGTAVPALSLVGYEDDVSAAMEYVFGRSLVCPDAETARAVTFHKNIRTMSITLQGDMFNPQGTIEGGSRSSAGSVLLKIQQVADLNDQLAAKREELATLDAELEDLEKASAEFATLSGEAEVQQHQVTLLADQLAQSQAAQLEAKLEELAATAAAHEEELGSSQTALAASQTAVQQLSNQIEHEEEIRQAAIKEMQTKIKAAKTIASKASTRADKAKQTAEETRLELEQSRRDVESAQQQVVRLEKSVVSLEEAVAALEAKVRTAREAYEGARAELEAKREAIASANKELKGLIARRDAAAKGASKADMDARKLEHKVARMQRERAAAEKTVEEMQAAHSWIEAEKQFFGKAHTDYDFAARKPEQAARRLKQLRGQLATLAKSLNKKVIGMIETAEKEYKDLMSKKRIIENDKAEIERVIEELDEKKNEALRTTWKKVNRDFGSIFSTLLPGTTGKLEPPAGGTVLDGLEVRVAFNGVWKESLTELSGGQRSLLALSLILSLLLFKPAPMYILDEVDAALDLSHTQNIGHMLRTHFTNSQFIVVSLKQGMFNNANVVYKTRFVDGVSQVTRTVPARSKLRGGAASGMGGGGAGAGAGAGAFSDTAAADAALAMDDDDDENWDIGQPVSKGKGKGRAPKRMRRSRTVA